MTTPDQPPQGSSRELPPLLLEQLALGELDAAQAKRVESELAPSLVAGDALARAGDALARIEASNVEILTDYPAPKVAAEIQRRLELGRAQQPKRAWIPWVLAPSLVAAAAVAWIIIQDPAPTVAVRDSDGGSGEIIGDGDPEVTRIKGAVDAHLVVDRRTGSGHERLAEGESVREGDLLQLSYVPAGQREGVIVSIDGAGAVTLHHPSLASDPPTLSDGKEVPLAHAYELDDAPSFERFVFVTRDGSSPSVAEVMRAAEQLAGNPSRARSQPLALAGEGWQQHSLLLRKPPASVEGALPAPTPAAPEEERP